MCVLQDNKDDTFFMRVKIPRTIFEGNIGQ